MGITTNVSLDDRPALAGRFHPRGEVTKNGEGRDDEDHGFDHVYDHPTGAVMSGAEMAFERHQRLALALLAIDGGPVDEVKAAMSRIIANAPVGTDIAAVLSLAMEYAGDQARGVGTLGGPESEMHGNRGRQRSEPVSAHENAPSRWWVAAAVPSLGAAALFGRLANLGFQTPKQGEVAAAAAMLSLTIGVAFLGAALIGVETLFLLRWWTSPFQAPTACPPVLPGWYLDPWSQAPSRWWNGFNWTGHLSHPQQT